MPCSCAATSPSRACSTCHGRQDDPAHHARASAHRGPHRARGPSCSGERARGDRESPAVGGRRELAARALARNQGSRPNPGLRRGGADVSVGLYGEYGGRYVPETLIPALDELAMAWDRGARTMSSSDRSSRSCSDLRGPADAAHARRALRSGQAALPEARGPPSHRRAQAEQRARPGAPRQTARQAADRRRDRRGPARRRGRNGLRALRPRMRRPHGLRGHAQAAAQRRAHAPARRGGAPGRVRNADLARGDERSDPRLARERRDDPLPARLLRRPASVSRARRASSRR